MNTEVKETPNANANAEQPAAPAPEAQQPTPAPAAPVAAAAPVKKSGWVKKTLKVLGWLGIGAACIGAGYGLGKWASSDAAAASDGDSAE